MAHVGEWVRGQFVKVWHAGVGHLASFSQKVLLFFLTGIPIITPPPDPAYRPCAEDVAPVSSLPLFPRLPPKAAARDAAVWKSLSLLLLRNLN